ARGRARVQVPGPRVQKASRPPGPWTLYPGPYLLAATRTTGVFTPLIPAAYRATPLNKLSATRSRYSGVCNCSASSGFETNEISARIDGIFAPINTTNGAFFTPRSFNPSFPFSNPLYREPSTSLANSLLSSIL